MVQAVLDAQALVAYLQGERGAETVASILEQATAHNNTVLISAVNWGEVYYIIARARGREQAEQTIADLIALPLEVVSVDKKFAYEAALLKNEKKLPYADAFAAALAKSRNAMLVTGDHDYKAVEGEVKIQWL